MGSFVGRMSQRVDMTGQKAQFVIDTIKKDKVVIFSKSYCPYCLMAKEQFQKLNHSFFALELDSRSDADEIQSILQELTGERTVPRVFIDGKCVGGGTDVKKMYENGSLRKALCI